MDNSGWLNLMSMCVRRALYLTLFEGWRIRDMFNSIVPYNSKIVDWSLFALAECISRRRTRKHTEVDCAASLANDKSKPMRHHVGLPSEILRSIMFPSTLGRGSGARLIKS